jgi:hypothetical protein
MTPLMESKIVDPHLREWIMPTFSTRVTDTTMHAIITMASMKAYFSYGFSIYCGIVKVTLEGTKEDWQKIASRLENMEKMPRHGILFGQLFRDLSMHTMIRTVQNYETSGTKSPILRISEVDLHTSPDGL